MICNSGVGLTPVVDGRVHWFGVCGIANGLAVMTDEETWSLWDHITGESFEGPSTGHVLDMWPLSLTTARAALVKDPAVVVLRPNYRSVFRRFARRVPWYRVNQRRFFPPSFRRSMSQQIDPRLPHFTQVGCHQRAHREVLSNGRDPSGRCDRGSVARAPAARGASLERRCAVRLLERLDGPTHAAAESVVWLLVHLPGLRDLQSADWLRHAGGRAELTERVRP